TSSPLAYSLHDALPIFARLIAHASHRTLVVKNFADFDALLATVGKNGVDIAASAITSTGATGANRSTFLTFSTTYYDANQGVLIDRKSTRLNSSHGTIL